MQRFGEFQLDTASQCLWRCGERIAITPRPFAVLQYLVEHPQRLVTHDELLEALWPETYVQPQVLRTYVLELRKLLADDPSSPRYIETVPKRGYRFLVRVAREGRGGGGARALMGRESELETLGEELERARAGERPTLFLTGESGLGKTALIDVFCNSISGPKSQTRIARGQSIEGFGGQEAFYPVREALNGLCAGDDTKAHTLLAASVPTWFGANHAPGLSAAPTIGEICEALEALSQHEALLLVFEDLHWADGSTLDLIAALARRRTRARLMLLASFRPTDLDARHPLRTLQQDLVTGGRAAELRLDPLSKSAVRELLRCRLNAETLPTGLVSLVHQHSTGNPLYIMAVLDHLRAQHVLHSNNGEAVLSQPLDAIELGVPDGLAGVIAMQVDRLSEDDRRLLEAGSIAGTIFPAWAAGAVLERAVDEMEEAYASLVRRERLIAVAGLDELPDGSHSTFYVFTHSLYRQAVYDGIPASRRGLWHQRIATRLRELFAENEARVAYEIEVHTRASAALR